MSSSAQIAANTINAQSSTGPRSEAGLATSSKNATTHGLFSNSDFIRPGEEEVYAQAKAELIDSLAPSGPLECNLVNEIHRAMWRLRRCGQVEANIVIGLDNGSGHIFDPMEGASAAAEKVQRSVDRARSQAHRLLHKCTAELRKLQTERRKGLDDHAAPQSGSFCKTEKTPPATPRNAPCPCKSGEKYKRCCGKNAPPTLGVARHAARHAA
jgi:hypothetical protein